MPRGKSVTDEFLSQSTRESSPSNNLIMSPSSSSSPISPKSSNRSALPKSSSSHENMDGIRKRVRKACDRCRMKKTKCDGSSPCLRCKTDNVICCSVEGQKLRRRNFPKGYAEMLEKQHNQLVCGLQELYQRLQKGSLWEGEPLDESSGRPLAHDILAALNLLEPKGDGSADSEVFEDFVDQPRSDSMLDETSEAVEIASADCKGQARHDSARQKPDNAPVSSDSELPAPAQTMASRSPSNTLQLGSPDQSPEQLDIQQHMFPDPTPLPIVLPHDQISPPWDDPLYSYDAPSRSSQSSSLDATNWNFQVQAMPPVLTQMPGLYHSDSSCNKAEFLEPRPSLGHNWLGSGIGFDSTDFMSESYRLSPQEAPATNVRKPTKTGMYT